MSAMPHLMTLAQWAQGQDWRLELQHTAPQHAFVLITRGQGIATLEGVRRGIGVNNVLVIPAHTLFSLHLGTQGFGQVCLIPAGSDILMPDTPQHLRLRDVQMQSELTGLLETMMREQNAARPFLDEALRAQAQLLTVWLRRALIETPPDDTRPDAADRLVRAFAALVVRDITRGLSMAEYARALGVTPTHLTRVCREKAGLTAADMLTQATLYLARDLLETTDRRSQAIAADLGFSSAAYFSRFIQHQTGLSPLALRKRATG